MNRNYHVPAIYANIIICFVRQRKKMIVRGNMIGIECFGCLTKI